jgi:hypothetical protein
MANLQQIKYALAVETTPGTCNVTGSGGNTWAALGALAPVKGLGTLDKTMERKEDDTILGTTMSGGYYDLNTNIAGNLTMNAKACAGYGHLVKANLGAEVVTQIGAGLVIMYTGAQPSCKIVVASGTIKSYIGALGAESLDATFGTAGTITLSGYATLSALQTYISGITNYTATIVMGASTAVTTSAIAITASQAAQKNVYVWFTSSNSGVYLHQITPDLSQNERPSISVQKELVYDNLLYTGCYVNELSLTASMKGYVTSEATILGFTETIGQSPSGLSAAPNQPLIFQNGTITLNGTTWTKVRNFSFKTSNSMFADGYGIGSLNRSYVLKALFKGTGDFQLVLDANSYLQRANAFQNGLNNPCALCFKGGTLSSANSLYEYMIIEMPYLQYQKPDFSENSGILDIKISYEIFNPAVATDYDGPLTISLVTTDSGTY